MYKSNETGKVYKDYQEYCNSDELEMYDKFLKLNSGERMPQNKREEDWLEEMRQMETEGKIIDIPFGTF